MRFLFEIIFCIGAAYGIGWFFSSYYGPGAHRPDDFEGLKHKQARQRLLALVPPGGPGREQPPEMPVPVRPVRDKRWLS